MINRAFVLDANAVLRLLLNEPGAQRVEGLIREARRSSTPLLLSVANWGEVFYLSWQRHGEEVTRKTIDDLSRLPIRVLPLELPQARKAAEMKARHQIPYVDCLAAALASLHQATLVTSDRDFEKLGRHFPILWIART
jgi:predicted nucleic acid-binding protein